MLWVLQVGSSAACLFYFSDLQDRLFRIEADRFGPVDQLDQGDALLSGFDMGDIGLRATEPLGEINLAQACLLAAFDQERTQSLVTSGFQGPRHSASRKFVSESKAERPEFAPRYIAQNDRSGRQGAASAATLDRLVAGSLAVGEAPAPAERRSWSTDRYSLLENLQQIIGKRPKRESSRARRRQRG